MTTPGAPRPDTDRGPERPPIVLNVDDDPLVRETHSLMLRAAGFEVVEAASGDEALVLAVGADVVLLDVVLAEASGFDVCQRLKSAPATSSIPVVLVSGIFTGAEHRSTGLDLGADAYLIKPVALRELVATVNAMLRVRRSERAQREAEARYRLLVERIPAVTYIAAADEDATLVFVSRQVEGLLGYSATEAKTRPRLWREHLHREDRDRVLAEFRTARREGRPARVEYRLLTRDGREVWIRDEAVIVPGDPALGHGVATYMTAERRATEQAAQRARHARLLVEVAAAFTGAEPLDLALRRAVDVFVRQIGMASARVRTLASPSPAWDVEGAAGLPVVTPAARAAFDRWVQRVVVDRRPVLIDVGAPGSPVAEWAADHGVAAFAAYPLVVDDRSIGVLELLSFAPLSPAARDGVAAAADALALGVERKRVAEALSVVQDEVTAALLSANVRLPDVLYRLGELARSVLAVDVVRVRLVNPRTGALDLTATSGTVYAEHWPVNEGFGRHLVTQRAPVAVVDVGSDSRFLDLERLRVEGVASVLGAPLFVDGAVVGTLTCWSRRRREWQAVDSARLDMLARHAAVAVRNARLFEETERRRRTAEVHAEVSRLVSRSLDPEEVSCRIVESARGLLGAEHAAVRRLDRATGMLYPLSISDELLVWNEAVPVGWSVSGLTVERGEPVWTSDILHDPGIRLADDLRAHLARVGQRAVLAVPLMVRGVVIGTLSAVYREVRSFDDDDVRLLQTFADQAALGLENARLFAEATRRRAEAEALVRTANALSANLDVPTVGRRVVEIARELFDVPVVGLRLLAADGSLVVVASTHEAFPVGHVLQPGEGVAGRSVAQGRVVSDDGTAVASDDLRRRWRESGIGSFASVALRVVDRALGTLTLGARAGRVFTPQEMTLLEALADQAALALANAQLYARLAAQVAASEQLARSATAAAEAKEDFLVSVSHELGTPLTAIKAYVDTLVAEPGLDAWLRVEFLGVLGQEVDRLTRLIGNILDASRLELGRLAVDVAEIDLAPVADSVAHMMSTRHLVRVESRGPVRVKGDVDRLKQVLLNLADNAVRHSPPGEPIVLRPSVEDGRAVVRVLDRGPGVDLARADELFRKFSPLARPGTDRRSGTGLGLYLSSEIVKAHGGTMRVERHEGWGGVFVVELPLAEASR